MAGYRWQTSTGPSVHRESAEQLHEKESKWMDSFGKPAHVAGAGMGVLTPACMGYGAGIGGARAIAGGVSGRRLRLEGLDLGRR